MGMARQPGTAERRDGRSSANGGPESEAPVARARAPSGAPRGSLHAAAGPLLIVNADDFGASSAINRAVVEAYRDGILTSASLMVTGDAADEAVALARAHPGLAVGLHLVLVQGRGATPPERRPHLKGADGRLPRDPVALGLRLGVDAATRREARAEIGAQLERFAATGLPLSHVDGHLNFHMHPAVLPPLAAHASALGAHGIRLPRDDLALALAHDRRRLGAKLVWAAAFGTLCAWAGPRLPAGLHAPDRVFGLFQSGRISPDYVLDALRTLSGDATAELYLHPTSAPAAQALGPNPGDLATLLDPAVRRAALDGGVRLATYAMLGRR